MTVIDRQRTTTGQFDIVPSIDILDGQVVRLMHGDFARVSSYGRVNDVLERWRIASGSRLHVVDLDGSRKGRSMEQSHIQPLLERDLRVQVGGGIRSVSDAMGWIEAGADRIVVGTVSSEDPAELERMVAAVGASRIVPALDLKDGRIRVHGWEQESRRSLSDVLQHMESIGIGEILVTDIGVDGTMSGPALETYRMLGRSTSVRVLASGGVASVNDLRSLSRLVNVSGAIIGRALHEGTVDLGIARSVLGSRTTTDRVIPCLDVRGGRVVKGVRFQGLRDAGDPAESATRYEREGADEIVVLDVSATQEERQASLDTVRRIADDLFIPLTVGGGVRSVGDFRALLRAGADRVAINTAAVQRPELITECAEEFGVQAVVLAVDAAKGPQRFDVVVRSGSESAKLDVVEWCARAEALGAGEILLTSIDRDGTAEGFDVPLLRSVTGAVKIGVIASGGAGRLEHFRDAIELGGARAVLAASLFHDGRLSVGEVKDYLERIGIDVRR